MANGRGITACFLDVGGWYSTVYEDAPVSQPGFRYAGMAILAWDGLNGPRWHSTGLKKGVFRGYKIDRTNNDNVHTMCMKWTATKIVIQFLPGYTLKRMLRVRK